MLSDGVESKEDEDDDAEVSVSKHQKILELDDQRRDIG